MSEDEAKARAIAALSGIEIRVRKVGRPPYKEGTYGTEIGILMPGLNVVWRYKYHWAEALLEIKNMAAMFARARQERRVA